MTSPASSTQRVPATAGPQLVRSNGFKNQQARRAAEHRAVQLFLDYGYSVERIANREQMTRLHVQKALRAAFGGRMAA